MVSFDKEQSEAVSNGEEGDVHPRVVFHLVIESSDRHGALGLIRLVQHAAAPNGVVHGNDAAGPQQHQTLLQVVAVAWFVRIDEGEVEFVFLALVY